jgi:transposase-like protein
MAPMIDPKKQESELREKLLKEKIKQMKTLSTDSQKLAG